MTPRELRTPRSSLRRWRESDLEPFAALNADPQVMRWLPAPLDRAASDAMVERIEAHHDAHGYGLWAVEVHDADLGPAPFVGFVGLARASFDPPFPHADPCVEVGWRLARAWWGRGIATEAATEALRFGFDEVGLSQIDSWTVPDNAASRRVMERAGMTFVGGFDHPRAAPQDWWRSHVLYRRTVQDHRASSRVSGRTSS